MNVLSPSATGVPIARRNRAADGRAGIFPRAFVLRRAVDVERKLVVERDVVDLSGRLILARCSKCSPPLTDTVAPPSLPSSKMFGWRGLIQTMWWSPCGSRRSPSTPCRRRVVTYSESTFGAYARFADWSDRRRSPCSRRRAGAASTGCSRASTSCPPSSERKTPPSFACTIA